MKLLGRTNWLVALVAAGGSAWAQSAVSPGVTAEPLGLPDAPPPVQLSLPAIQTDVPFIRSTNNLEQTVGAMAEAASGRSALASGLPSIAIQSFSKVLAAPGLSQEARDALNLDLATAYLADANLAGARAALKEVTTASNSAAYILRDTLLKEQEGQWVTVSAQLAQVPVAQLSASDLPWYYLAAATLAEWEKKPQEANADWTKAIANAVNPLQAAQFEAERWKGQLYLGLAATPEIRDQLQKQMDAAVQDPINGANSAQYALDLAIVLDKLGDPSGALQLLQKNLQRVGLDRSSLNKLRLEYVIIDQQAAAPDAARDQETLQAILKDWPEKGAPDLNDLVNTQKIALDLLENGKLAQNAKDLKALLDALVLDPRGHPLIKQLYLLQMQLALGLNQNDQAAAAAQLLLTLPKDQELARDTAREGAWLTLAYVAWSATPKQILEAAKNLNSLREALPVGEPERRVITARLADLNFLNGDRTPLDKSYYATAASLYATLIKDPPPEENLGSLLERAVESEIKAGNLAGAIARLDEVAPQLADADERWRAEYNLLLALRDNHEVEKAFARLTRLLDAGHINLLQIELRLCLRWLDASLAVEVHDPSAADKAQILQDEAEIEMKAAVVAGSKALEASRRELAAAGLLLKVRAADDTGKAAEMEKCYTELQTIYKQTDAAVEGLLWHANKLADQNDKNGAAKDLISLVDQFIDAKDPAKRQNPGAEYAPRALYQLALYNRDSDGDGKFEAALASLKKFAENFPDEFPLIFYVRYEQGELYSRRNDFTLALDIFENLLDLLNKQHLPLSDELWAQALMARANCLNAIAMKDHEDVQKRRVALEALDHLSNLNYLPVWAQVQAGYDYAHFLDDDALKPAAYWKVINILDKPKQAAELDKTTSGREFLARSVNELGDYFESQKDYDSARMVYQKAVENNVSAPYFQNKMLSLPAMAGPRAAAPAATPGPAPTPAVPATAAGAP